MDNRRLRLSEGDARRRIPAAAAIVLGVTALAVG
jgi:hypothetical protein